MFNVGKTSKVTSISVNLNKMDTSALIKLMTHGESIWWCPPFDPGSRK